MGPRTIGFWKNETRTNWSKQLGSRKISFGQLGLWQMGRLMHLKQPINVQAFLYLAIYIN